VLAQLQLPRSLQEKAAARYHVTNRNVLIWLILYLLVGMIFCCCYIGKSLLDSWEFIINSLMVTGNTDILAEPLLDGFSVGSARLFLIMYITCGILLVFTSIQAQFNSTVERFGSWIEGKNLLVFQDISAWDGWQIASGQIRLLLASILFLFSSGVVGFYLFEGWDLAKASYYTSSCMMTIGFTSFQPQLVGGRIFAVCFMPVASLFFFGVLSRFLILRESQAKSQRQKCVLDGLISSPDDLAFLQDKTGRVSKYAYARYVLLRAGKLDEEDLQAIEESFANLDSNGDGMIESFELGRRRPGTDSDGTSSDDKGEVVEAMLQHRASKLDFSQG